MFLDVTSYCRFLFIYTVLASLGFSLNNEATSAYWIITSVYTLSNAIPFTFWTNTKASKMIATIRILEIRLIPISQDNKFLLLIDCNQINAQKNEWSLHLVNILFLKNENYNKFTLKKSKNYCR